MELKLYRLIDVCDAYFGGEKSRSEIKRDIKAGAVRIYRRCYKCQEVPEKLYSFKELFLCEECVDDMVGV